MHSRTKWNTLQTQRACLFKIGINLPLGQAVHEVPENKSNICHHENTQFFFEFLLYRDTNYPCISLFSKEMQLSINA